MIEPTSLAELGLKEQVIAANASKPAASDAALTKVVDNFYFTDAISRSSPTMAKCSIAFSSQPAADEPQVAFG